MKAIIGNMLPFPRLWIQALKAAEYYLIRKAQEQFPPSEKLKGDLRTFLERGIIKCLGRLKEANIPEEAKFPIYLPPEAWIIKLIVMHFHYKKNHTSYNALLSIIRENFWIPKGRQFVRNVIRDRKHGCFECRKERMKPYTYPEVPHLPKERLMMTRPFEQTGVDYFGPIKIKKQEKCYLALYTCLVVRVIHLEIASDYSASEFMRTFRRFCDRRGWPKLVLSDNAANFVLGSEHIREEWKRSIASQALQEGISWKFITPKTPWMGGTWERMVGITKNARRKCVGRSLLSKEEFSTLICEIEAVVNSRPLTFQQTQNPLRP